jgi:hypothetical protein
MLYGSRFCGYAPYAHGLRSCPFECIILRMARKMKLTNCLSYSEHWINFHIIYYPLYILIMQVYHDSERMRDFGCMPDSGRKIWLRSYIQTLVALPDSGRCHNFGRISWLRLHNITPINERATCLTYSAVKDFEWSPAWLGIHITTQPSRPGSIVASMTQQHCRQHDSASTSHHGQVTQAASSLAWLSSIIASIT